jgi:hypothetical protein
MADKPTFQETCAGVFLQIGTIPAEIYLKEIMTRLPEGNVVKTSIRDTLREGKEGIEKAVAIMKDAQEQQSRLIVPDTETVAAVNAQKEGNS